MFVALDKDGNRILASGNIDRNGEYFCPVCNGKAQLKAGSVNAAHFAHINKDSCTDDFTNDMSEWHRKWQELFHPNNREVVIAHGEEKHRADVLCYGTVIEFQHSQISEDEFWRRNNFYTDAGYKVVWIFDAIDVVDDGRLVAQDNDWETSWDYGTIFKWKYPWRFLSDFVPQDEKNVSVFFQMVPFGNDPKDKYEVCYMENAVWVSLNYKTLWGYFLTSLNKPTNYAELLEWLKQRSEKEKEKEKRIYIKEEREACPECGGTLCEKAGPFGRFMGCSNYPKCKYTSNLRKNRS